jgi:hypothetical protein
VTSVEIPARGPVETSAPRALFVGPPAGEGVDEGSWDAADGKSFVFVQEDTEPQTSINLELGWFDELRALGQR